MEDPLANFILSIHEASRNRDKQSEVLAWFRFAILGSVMVFLLAVHFMDEEVITQPALVAPDCTTVKDMMVGKDWWKVCVAGAPGMIINGQTVMPVEPNDEQ